MISICYIWIEIGISIILSLNQYFIKMIGNYIYIYVYELRRRNIFDGARANISACHAGDPSSILGRRDFLIEMIKSYLY